jgi:hypothetical protein
VDPGLHRLQGKAEGVRASDLLDLLVEFTRDKLTLKAWHEAGARAIVQYDLNNTYQYVIAREDVQAGWLRAAIEDLGGRMPEPARPEGQPAPSAEAAEAILRADLARATTFVDGWTPRVDAMTHARHRRMLSVILGETLEHKRFFEQALAGRSDLLGRRTGGAPTAGVVLATRWRE